MGYADLPECCDSFADCKGTTAQVEHAKGRNGKSTINIQPVFKLLA